MFENMFINFLPMIGIEPPTSDILTDRKHHIKEQTFTASNLQILFQMSKRKSNVDFVSRPSSGKTFSPPASARMSTLEPLLEGQENGARATIEREGHGQKARVAKRTTEMCDVSRTKQNELSPKYVKMFS